ncbi:DUF3800 domain-containing protein [Pseudogracilibacillus auburnensis]|uniref:DUF3800 domain-containing protein n=1 Tax=Pseudogracilibacillus auburnensis TaxID=1494959 RepID=UPI001A969BF0|nr:DUF3800 domain-containing protein [Pseudogracilibacillus auburnensis]MBO1005918.1 DUF3800 domain-containing protein [Pseudogracilibacillus auburnensis]
MGILYIDEAGNSGYKDLAQPNLIYGGPYINPTQWRSVLADYEKVVATYKSLIFSRFSPPQQIPKSFEKLAEEVKFFHEFDFHARNIMVRTGLWGKLDNTESCTLLSDLIDIMINNNVMFHAGMLNKAKLRADLTGTTGKIDSLVDFQTLVPLYFNRFEQAIGKDEEYVVVVADGEVAEKNILHSCLQAASLSKCNPELLIQKAESNPYLQLADVGLWIIQAYHKLQASDTNKKSQNIRSLYQKLTPIMRLYTY